MVTVTSIPQVEVFPLVPGVALSVEISRAGAPARSQAVEDAWSKLVAGNPRLFDGPLLSVLSLGPASAEHPTNEVTVRRDRFSRLAVQPGVRTGVRILSVTGVLMSTDGAGKRHVLLGRRGSGTRIYDGMWELGPSGGLQEPPPAVAALDEGAVFSHLADEVSEEVGLHIEQGRAVCVVRDHFAMSDDLVFVCEVGPLERVRAAPANWEYSETAWVAVDEVPAFERAHGAEVIAPTRGIFRAFGWV
ncbi:MAG: hypothetical protein U0637_11540 [Phycisphaerales bacterium]